jgi:dimethylhistidine N-methyltransferase
LLKTLDAQTLAFRDDVLAGLAAPIPAIPARWLYDRRGSELFDEITRLPSYYPTRTETAIFHSIMDDIAARVPKGAAVVEFGAGSQTKTPILLEAIAPAAYIPVDISGDYLEHSAAELQQRFPKIEVIPVVADFARPFSLPGGIEHLPKLGFFPGSTIGNFVPWSATDLLRQFRALLGPGSQLLIGMDRVKPVDRLIAAYDDPEGVTPQFTLNVLTRVNRELDGDIPVDAFRHDARWNDILSRIEIHLVAKRDVSFSVSGEAFSFAQGSSIHVENSHKYGQRGGRVLLLAGGWTPIAEWTDPAGDFAEILAVAEPERFAP